MQRVFLRTRIVAILLAVSLVPVLLMGLGAWILFGRTLEARAVELQRTLVESHARAITAFLEERVRLLKLITRTRTLEELTAEGRLAQLLAGLNAASDEGFVDLGVIAGDGRHLAYAGPYDLADRNYREADWFREVRAEGVHLSDLFLGFRNVPHRVIAVRREGPKDPWILRATLDHHAFDDLVRTGPLGDGGDAFLLDREGRFQTAPRRGALLEKSAHSTGGLAPGYGRPPRRDPPRAR